jgi:hypothetical protein
MTEFDELLNEVLSEDARVEVPMGMEMRIALAPSEERRRRFSKRRLWVEAVAAAILLGLATTWSLRGFRQLVPVAPEAGFVVALRSAADNSVNLRSTTQASQGPALGLAYIPETRPQRKIQTRAAQISPLEIEPLVIRPIEIASLPPRTSTGNGEVR